MFYQTLSVMQSKSHSQFKFGPANFSPNFSFFALCCFCQTDFDSSHSTEKYSFIYFDPIIRVHLKYGDRFHFKGCALPNLRWVALASYLVGFSFDHRSFSHRSIGQHFCQSCEQHFFDGQSYEHISFEKHSLSDQTFWKHFDRSQSFECYF